MFAFLLRGSPRFVVLRAALLIAAIAVADWRVEVDIPLGFLYLFPMLVLGGALSRWQIAIAAAVCTALTESFDNFDFFGRPSEGITKNILIFAAFFGTGLFVYEAVRNRKITLQHVSEIENEVTARREAEEQLKILVESSPAAIVTTDSEGDVLLANGAAHRLFALEPGALAGRSIRDFLPALVNAAKLNQQQLSFRTMMQCRGRRTDGEAFLADVWFSTYMTSAGPRLAAMVVDTSEDLRTREESGLHQLLASSRILVGAVSHEIRNVCGAIALVHENLWRTGTLAENKDFEALGTLVKALERIAAIDLSQTAQRATTTDIYSLLEELRIVVEPSFRESDVAVQWRIEAGIPAVWADRQSLMQVFLNVTKNAERALQGQERRELTIAAQTYPGRVSVTFVDSGGGVLHPERLFHPFQQGSEATGLGLYLSRAFMRSFKGELRYEPRPGGAQFSVDLAPVTTDGEEEAYGRANPDSTDRRPQLVPGGA